MKNFVWLILSVFILFPNFVSADSATRDMVSLKLIDKSTGEVPRTAQNSYYLSGPVNIRCYGYKWKDLGYGLGFDEQKPENYAPEEVYTISEYYKSEYSLMDWTHYIRFKTIDYCDFEWETGEGVKFVSRAYHDWPVFEDSCKFVSSVENYEIFHIDRVCNMELTVEKVEKFDWESDAEVKDDCPKTICPADDIKPVETWDNPEDTVKNQNTTPKQQGLWEQVRCWIIGWLGGKC